MKMKVMAACAAVAAIAVNASAEDLAMKQNMKIRLITLDPGHFHASLVQKSMYDQVDPVVHVYAPEGPDVEAHLKRIADFNNRPERPTKWEEQVYRGPDFLQKMISEKQGNVVVISGNNAKKARYIADAVNAGFNVLADKPMAIRPADFDLLVTAFDTARKNGVLLYDIMTERYEITTILQRELSRVPEVFGELQKGTPEKPAVTKESVHHFLKTVSGKPLLRPQWFFDVSQQGEGIVDVTSHLVDLVQWECFPDQVLDYARDVRLGSARRWATQLSPEQFKQVTGSDTFPDYLRRDVAANGMLNVFANGEINYTLKGVHAKVSVTWNFEAPPGAKDTHYSIMRGTDANLVIRQGKDEQYKPGLYVENVSKASADDFEKTLTAAIKKLGATYAGIGVEKIETGWKVTVPDSLRVDHEAHFAQVTEKYLRFLQDGRMPAWEVPNMIAKYYTIMRAYEISRQLKK